MMNSGLSHPESNAISIREERDDEGRLVARIGLVDGVLHGTAEYFDAGRPVARIDFVNGKKHGIAEFLHPNGKIRQRLGYENDALNGTVETLDPEGNPLLTETYRAGALEGPMTAYYPGTTAMLERSHYRAGLLDGESVKYWDSGKLMEEKTFAGGEELRARQYDADGQLIADSQDPGLKATGLAGFLNRLVGAQ